jgi:hypothetical protein
MVTQPDLSLRKKVASLETKICQKWIPVLYKAIKSNSLSRTEQQNNDTTSNAHSCKTSEGSLSLIEMEMPHHLKKELKRMEKVKADGYFHLSHIDFLVYTTRKEEAHQPLWLKNYDFRIPFKKAGFSRMSLPTNTVTILNSDAIWRCCVGETVSLFSAVSLTKLSCKESHERFVSWISHCVA